MFSQGKRAVHPAAGLGLELGLRQIAHRGEHLPLFGADVEVHAVGVPVVACCGASVGGGGAGGQIGWAVRLVRGQQASWARLYARG